MATLAKGSRTISEDLAKSAISAYGPARSTIKGAPLSSDELREIDAYWSASLYLCLGMLYLKDNSLLHEPLDFFTPDKPVVFNFHSYPWLIHDSRTAAPAGTISTYAVTSWPAKTRVVASP